MYEPIYQGAGRQVFVQTEEAVKPDFLNFGRVRVLSPSKRARYKLSVNRQVIYSCGLSIWSTTIN